MRTVYYPNNLEKFKVHSKQWAKNNPDKVKKANKKYESKEETKLRKKQWTKDNREHINKKRNIDRYAKNHYLKDKEWVKNNKEKVRISQERYKLKRKGAPKIHTANEWNELKICYNFKCANCPKEEPEIKLTKDHLIPFVEWNNYKHLFDHEWDDIKNIQPLCGSCNCKKNRYGFKKYLP